MDDFLLCDDPTTLLKVLYFVKIVEIKCFLSREVVLVSYVSRGRASGFIVVRVGEGGASSKPDARLSRLILLKPRWPLVSVSD